MIQIQMKLKTLKIYNGKYYRIVTLIKREPCKQLKLLNNQSSQISLNIRYEKNVK